MKKGVPIKPSEIPAAKAAVIPPFVFDCFNECIAKHYKNGRAYFCLKEIQTLVEQACRDAGILYDYHFLDVERVYEQNGWTVTYDSPGYGDDYPSTFTFIQRIDDGPLDSK